ncbi:NAD-dependent epimerase/dehydratase family protein [Chitinophaga sp. GCM10012297]|uniref:NAD-dependent epimerase/dehydratase family protein n=1 Tax=Chitinophaga chungangae TaxID=2821488 RepID=A0ABS3YF09_9BACT|nr:NAD-dependent epimerase/dehydratase family protein [Chitinophaga chungangae]MBO9153277.1 NAD-dependent epimerase/dehydratase family protein [Chitinophaga chungangae]
MRIAMTGATGFVGKNLVPYLRQHTAHDILEISRRTVQRGNECVTFEQFRKDAPPYDAFIHLAGKAHDVKNTADAAEYFKVNYELTREMFDHFRQSSATVFIYLSSVKAVADLPEGPVTEDMFPSPQTPYGQSKLKAEEYLASSELAPGKKLYILRPCMIHGPENKGNLNLLTALVKKNIPYPLGAFLNSRSFLSVENLCFVINKLLAGNTPSGIYNVADDEPLSTNELVRLIGVMMGKPAKIWAINKHLVRWMAKAGDLLRLPFNSEALQKLTTDYVVSNAKLMSVLDAALPVNSREGLTHTLQALR